MPSLFIRKLYGTPLVLSEHSQCRFKNAGVKRSSERLSAAWRAWISGWMTQALVRSWIGPRRRRRDPGRLGGTRVSLVSSDSNDPPSAVANCNEVSLAVRFCISSVNSPRLECFAGSCKRSWMGCLARALSCQFIEGLSRLRGCWHRSRIIWELGDGGMVPRLPRRCAGRSAREEARASPSPVYSRQVERGGRRCSVLCGLLRRSRMRETRRPSGSLARSLDGSMDFQVGFSPSP